jgi:hypothetical protein
MNRLVHLSIGLALFALSAAPAFTETGFQSITVLASETWTGNAYRPPYMDVTGSETSPIDLSLGAGARLNLVAPLFSERLALSVDPRLALSARRYLLYSSGRVVPAPQETALGADENLEPGLGSARVLTFALAAPLGIEVGITESVALTIGVSPTMLFRVRAGAVEFLNDKSDLNGMYSFFYGRMRWLRPELHIAARFDLSQSVAFAVRTTASVSMLDLSDSTLPWWDLLKVSGALELCASPPLRAAFRQPDEQSD